METIDPLLFQERINLILPAEFKDRALKELQTLIQETQLRADAIVTHSPTQSIDQGEQINITLLSWLKRREIDDAYTRYEQCMTQQEHVGYRGYKTCTRTFFTIRKGGHASPYERWKVIEHKKIFPGTKVIVITDNNLDQTYRVEYITRDCSVKLVGVNGIFNPLNIRLTD